MYKYKNVQFIQILTEKIFYHGLQVLLFQRLNNQNVRIEYH